MLKKNDWRNNIPPADFEDLKDKWWQVESPTSFALTFLGVAIIVGGGWYFLGPDQSSQRVKTVPLIRAETGPSKIRPEDAGKTNVPHQDKLVYNRLNPQEKSGSTAEELSGRVEHLLPPPEAPMAREKSNLANSPISEQTNSPPPIIMAEDETSQASVENQQFPVIESQLSNPTEKPQENALFSEKEPLEESLTASSERETPPQNTKVDSQVEDELPKAKDAPMMLSKSVKVPLKGGFRVQIGALPSSELAKTEWNRLRKVYTSVLENQTPHFVRVDLGASKGVYHRIQVGHFKSKQQAQAFCNKLNQVGPKLGCMIVPQ